MPLPVPIPGPLDPAPVTIATFPSSFRACANARRPPLDDGGTMCPYDPTPTGARASVGSTCADVIRSRAGGSPGGGPTDARREGGGGRAVHVHAVLGRGAGRMGRRRHQGGACGHG